MKNDRQFQILYTLLEKNRVTAPQLAERLGVSVRTIYRDMEALSLAGVPIYTEAGRGGGLRLMPGYTLNKAVFSDEEQNQILFALQGLRMADRPVDALVNKLGGMFQKQSVNWIDVDFSRWGFGNEDKERFEHLKTAIMEKRVLNLLYCGASGETTRRKVKPFKLAFREKNWYLQAYCLKANDYRLFKISRIVELSVEAETFTEDFADAPSLEYDTPAARPYHMVKILFTPAVAYRAYDDFARSSIEKQPDGSLLVTTVLPDNEWILAYLVTFGTDATVLEPLALRRQMAEYALRIVEKYQT